MGYQEDQWETAFYNVGRLCGQPRNSDEVSRAIQAISGFGRNDYDYQAQRHGAW